MAPTRELDILLRFLTDAKSAGDFARATDNIIAHFSKLEEKIAATRKQAQLLKTAASEIANVSRDLTVVGLALSGGIFAAAGKYVKDAKTATSVTVQWKAAQEQLNKAGERFGAVAATTTLPLLKRAAQLSESVAGFVEKHPDLVRIALNAGLVTATIGAVGSLVAKGVKFYADFQLLGAFLAEKEAAKQQKEAALVMLAASENQLRAAGLGSQIDALKKGGAASAGAGTAGAVGLFAGGVAVSALIANSVDNNIKKLGAEVAKLTDNAGLGATVITALTGALTPILPMLPGIQSLKNNLPQIAKLLSKLGIDLGNKTSNAPTGTIGAREEVEAPTRSKGISDALLKAYADYVDDDLKLVQQHYADRQGVIASALNAESAENKKYADSVAKINQQTAKSLSSLAVDFARDNAEAEQRYQTQRVQIIRDGDTEIQRIEEESKERIRKLTEDHNDRVESLTAARDALGLAKENRQFKRDIRDEKNDTKKEINQRREDLALRLSDLKQSYEQERAQRLAEYQARVIEIRADAAERLKELAQQHADELKQIREQKAAKLKEIDQQFADERLRRRQYFIQQIRDTDAALLNETKLRRAYQTQMLNDLNSFLASYRAGLQSLKPPGAAEGGYVSGLRMTGEKGVEYVMTNQTVRAAENIIGGRLTQDSLLAAMTGRSGTTVNYNGRFSGEYSASMRRAVRRDVSDAMSEAFNGI